MSAHYHIATVVKFNPSEKIDLENPLFSCLYPVKLDNNNPQIPVLEEMFLFSTKADGIPKIESRFLLADFFYLKDNNQKRIKRCKVLCPIIDGSLKDENKISDNFYKILVSSRQEKRGGHTGCSPKNYAYLKDKKTLFQVSIKGDMYVPMYCFPDESSSALNAYFAFCKVNVDLLRHTDKEWAHNDDPKLKSDLSYKSFMSHNYTDPYD